MLSTTSTDPSLLLNRYQQVRQISEKICQPLAIEDYLIQSMPDVSPPKWHLAHTTWFFETFLLLPHLPGYTVFHPQFNYLFNSYYDAVGARHPRDRRGMLSRPTVAEVYRYRAHVDRAMTKLVSLPPKYPDLVNLIILGLHHEQQHQELLLTDIKHILALNPLQPLYRDDLQARLEPVESNFEWLEYPGGLYSIGHQGSEFAFDNESPRHQTYLRDYKLGNRLVTNGEYLEFMQAGGYRESKYWLAEGWATVQNQQWKAPLYWELIDGEWWVMTLGGLQELNNLEPVCHVSFYEADAYASWKGKRLPTEAEWEIATGNLPRIGNFLDSNCLHPIPAENLQYQFFGDVWEWTQSAYLPYPGFQIADGAIGEYNGKFMCNQMVLRGGSCVTSIDHIRPTYRNFFPPSTRWQFSGIRLASE
ncbi:ergothioneine biosynthesis protein EgtB [Chamaesiphon sp. VAR_48_metabat_135_sub]|uniref:ergothioneine biosynthesis protein EgtB n=1 Tax=Chamaesiphon sp. VAR_48_metabat_135_sub TaxID=2964699 RepID=UPI00286C8721|nr:ergothioneine biosynthesis protein EgtB [Chamaesiphon sp. VAR_48_metabat_135_sub]